MSARVYLLLDLVNIDSGQVARTLRSKPGVVTVDVLEGPPDMLVVIEALRRRKAADYLMGLLDSVDGMIENLRVLPVQKGTAKRSLAEIGKRNAGLERKLKEEVQL
jgi:hypothetical protein